MNSVTSAVAAYIADEAGRVLLAQHSQGHRLWGLPGGRIRPGESPIAAAVRDIREETGLEIGVADLVGLYTLTGATCGDDVPDVLVHVFRARVEGGEALVNSPGRICRLSWHETDALPTPMTATTRAALADAAAGRTGVVRTVQRDAEPELPDADDAPADTSIGSLAPA